MTLLKKALVSLNNLLLIMQNPDPCYEDKVKAISDLKDLIVELASNGSE